MEFKMKLQSLPFSVIESGRKSIELRLYDEKRKQIAVGDTIRFCLGLGFCLCFGSRFVDMFENLTVCQYHLARVDATWGNTAQFGGASGSVFSAICGMQIPRFISSKPLEFAFASDEKSIRRPTASFVRCYLRVPHC